MLECPFTPGRLAGIRMSEGEVVQVIVVTNAQLLRSARLSYGGLVSSWMGDRYVGMIITLFYLNGYDI